MIDLMQRLAELDAKNPSIVKEKDQLGTRAGINSVNQKPRSGQTDMRNIPAGNNPNARNKFTDVDRERQPDELKKTIKGALGKHTTPNLPEQDVAENLEECGMMDTMGGMSQPRTPASINMTAASGEELSGMLKDIMSLAGMKTVGQDDLGADHDSVTLTTEPVSAVGPAASDNELMRSMLDKMNTADGDEEDGEEKTGETVDSLAADPNGAAPFDANRSAHQENQPGQGVRMDGDRPKAFATMEQQLMAEYKKFINEDQDVTESTGMPYKHESYFADKMYTAVGGKDMVNVVDSPDGKYGYYKDLDGKTIGIFQRQDYTIHDGPGVGTINQK